MRLAEIHEKPRERLERYGAAALSDAELYALVLTAGTRKAGVLDVAQRVSFYLSSHRQLPTLSELVQLPGIGKARACQIMAVLELCRRREQNAPEVIDSPATSAAQVFKLYKSLFFHSFAEEFYVLFLDAKLNVVACEQLFLGTLDSITIHPREIYHRAIKHLAHSIIVMHNHPSGDPAPSSQDLVVTGTLQEVGEIVGIPLVDHIIFGASSFWSWSESANKIELDSDVESPRSDRCEKSKSDV